MSTSRSFVAAVVLLLAATASFAQVNYAAFGAGVSSNATKTSAAQAAARAAKDSLHGATPRLVIVFNKDYATQNDAITGVTREFADSTVVVVSGPNTFTGSGRDPSVAVWAVGGYAGIARFVVPVSNATNNAAFRSCGRALGDSINNVPIPTGCRRVVFLFGGCNFGYDSVLVNAMLGRTGDTLPLVGMSTVRDNSEGNVYVGGTTVATSNVAVVLWGSFEAGFGMVTSTDQSNIVEDARAAVRASIDSTGHRATTSLIFDCAGRYGRMNTTALQQELSAITSETGTGVSVNGIYCYGEIGKANNRSKAYGSGLSIAVVSFAPDTLPTSVAYARWSAPTRLDARQAGDARVFRLDGSIVATAPAVKGALSLPSTMLSSGVYLVRLTSVNGATIRLGVVR